MAQSIQLGQVASREGGAKAESKKGPSSMTRFGWFVILFGFVGFLLWAMLAPLDEGVPAPGVVVVDGQRKVVQHPSGGIVESIFVSDGVTVEAGDILIKLNDVGLRATREVARAQWISAKAREARLASELAQADEIEFPPELLAFGNEPDVQQTMSLQNLLLKSRRQVFEAEVSALEENLRGLQAQISAAADAKESRGRELAAVSDQYASLEGLVGEGYVSNNRLRDLERQRAQLQSLMAGLAGERGRLVSQAAEVKLLIARARDEAVTEIQSELIEMRREADAAMNQLISADFDLANTEIKAPTSGVVVGLDVFTEGGVIGSGQRIMDIVPTDQPLEVEAQVPVHLIDSVQIGLPVDLMFTALNQNVTPIVQGEVVNVSADRLVDETTNAPYFKAKIRATDEGVAQLKGQKVRPGMQVEAFIKTGERSLMTYLLKPLRDRAATALTEK